jgi:hypothetical protein
MGDRPFNRAGFPSRTPIHASARGASFVRWGLGGSGRRSLAKQIIAITVSIAVSVTVLLDVSVSVAVPITDLVPRGISG